MSQYYSLSQTILAEIKKAKRILINVHRNPDLDTVGSATALYQVLIKMGKDVSLVCPHEIPKTFLFIKDADKIKKIDFNDNKNFESYDLFLILDSGSYNIVTGDKKINLPKINKIIIDHHLTDNWDSYVYRLLDTKASATAEIVYRILSDWEIDLVPDLATSLLSGIVGDTVFFKYPKEPSSTFKIVSNLIENGARYDVIINKFNDSMEIGFVKIIGEFIRQMKIEKTKKISFAWSALPYKTYEAHNFPKGAREAAADSFFRSVEGVAFGIAMVEYAPGKISVSFRSKGDFDVSKIAENFGGGGHKNAAGATIIGEFDKAVSNIVDKVKYLN